MAAPAALLAAFAVLTLAAVALAARPATPAERAEITHLVRGDHSGDIAHPGRVTVGKITVSTKAPWALAELAQRIPGERSPDMAGGLFKRRGGHYRLVRIGTDGLACGLLSKAVAKELGLFPCT